MLLFHETVFMNILFIHQNFPGQFKHLAPALTTQGHTVLGMTMQQVRGGMWRGVQVVPYTASRSSTEGIHPWVSDFESKVIRAEACFNAASRLRDEGFIPDIVVAHPGWGESLFIKEVWPSTLLGIYCEFFYPTVGADVGFDKEFDSRYSRVTCKLHVKNAHNLMQFTVADKGISPTEWQASTFPEPFRKKISVIHDGIDTSIVKPDPDVTLTVSGSLRLTRDDEVVTFVNRNLEPYRGYHIYMRALPDLMRRRPKAHFIVVGGGGVSYGAKPPEGKTWKEIFLSEVKDDLDLSRLHFVGRVPYREFLALLRLSTVHVYLTYPFVLSWSLLEAMSCGCAIVASGTEPLREAITHGETGRLVDFFDRERLVAEVCTLLDDHAGRERLGNNAREFAVSRYDLRTVCLPRQLEWVHNLASLKT